MRYFNRHTERMDSSTMSRLPMTDGIYLGDNLLVPPMPPIPTIAAPWLQFDANGGLVATDLTGLRNATKLIPTGVVTGITSVNLDLPDAQILDNICYGNSGINNAVISSTSENIVSATGLTSNNPSLETLRVYLPNYTGTLGSAGDACTKLSSAELIAPKVSGLSYYCFRDTALTSIILQLDKCAGMPYCFRGCSFLPEFSADLPNLTDAASAWAGTTSLKTFNVTWPKISNLGGAFTNSGLETDEINKILTSLPTYTSGSHVITFTGCPGAPTCDTSIGTKKGWTVQI